MLTFGRSLFTKCFKGLGKVRLGVADDKLIRYTRSGYVTIICN